MRKHQRNLFVKRGSPLRVFSNLLRYFKRSLFDIIRSPRNPKLIWLFVIWSLYFSFCNSRKHALRDLNRPHERVALEKSVKDLVSDVDCNSDEHKNDPVCVVAFAYARILDEKSKPKSVSPPPPSPPPEDFDFSIDRGSGYERFEQMQQWWSKRVQRINKRHKEREHEKRKEEREQRRHKAEYIARLCEENDPAERDFVQIRNMCMHLGYEVPDEGEMSRIKLDLGLERALALQARRVHKKKVQFDVDMEKATDSAASRGVDLMHVRMEELTSGNIEASQDRTQSGPSEVQRMVDALTGEHRQQDTDLTSKEVLKVAQNQTQFAAESVRDLYQKMYMRNSWETNIERQKREAEEDRQRMEADKWQQHQVEHKSESELLTEMMVEPPDPFEQDRRPPAPGPGAGGRGGELTAAAPTQMVRPGELARVKHTLVFEAEDAALQGCKAQRVYEHYSGAGYVSGLEAARDSSITWAVEVPDSGKYHLAFTYSLGADREFQRELLFQVNRQTLDEAMAFDSTSDWNTWLQVEAAVQLYSRVKNVVRLVAVHGAGPAVDKLTVSGPVASSP